MIKLNKDKKPKLNRQQVVLISIGNLNYYFSLIIGILAFGFVSIIISILLFAFLVNKIHLFVLLFSLLIIFSVSVYFFVKQTIYLKVKKIEVLPDELLLRVTNYFNFSIVYCVPLIHIKAIERISKNCYKMNVKVDNDTRWLSFISTDNDFRRILHYICGKFFISELSYLEEMIKYSKDKTVK